MKKFSLKTLLVWFTLVCIIVGAVRISWLSTYEANKKYSTAKHRTPLEQLYHDLFVEDK